jgi:hypothetical protein
MAETETVPPPPPGAIDEGYHPRLLRALAYGPQSEGATADDMRQVHGAFGNNPLHGPESGQQSIAVSPNQLDKYPPGTYWDAIDKNGNVVRRNLRVDDKSYYTENNPTENTIELYNDKSFGQLALVPAGSPPAKPLPFEGPTGKETAAAIKSEEAREGDGFVSAESGVPAGWEPSSGAPPPVLSGVPPPPPGAILDDEPQAPQPQPVPVMVIPPPPGAAPAAPISQSDVAAHDSAAAADPNADPDEAREQATQNILQQHSMALSPEDKRVALRINPDTGSLRTTGAYFVNGDPAHERLLEHTSDYDRDKLPVLSAAIARGDPYSFLYRSAEEEMPGEGRPTAETRQFEYGQSTAAQRAESSEGQLQRVTMVPQQFAVTKPSKDNPRRVMLEGFASDSALNNSVHTLNAAAQVGIPVPYQDTGFNYQKDLAGYIQNQQHGYRGDGSGPIIDANNVPNKIWLAEQNKPAGQRYIPHLLSPDKAEFINTAMNIVPSGRTKAPTLPPSFSENAQWLSRVNQGYIGQEGSVNKLREELDRRMPPVGMRNKKGKVTRHVPWSKGTLEPTYRAYRLDLIHSTLPHPTSPESIRARENIPHEPHIIPKAPIAVHTAAEYKIPAWQKKVEPTPVSENPEVGAPIGEGQGGSKVIPFPQQGPTLLPRAGTEASRLTQPIFKSAGVPAEEQRSYIDPERITKKVKTDQIRWLPTEQVNSRWKSSPYNSDFYIPPGATRNAIGDRYQGAMEHIGSEAKMHAPEASLWEDGTIHFSDGRHRFAAMRDLGHTHVPIALSAESIKNAKKLGMELPKDPEVGSPETAVPTSAPTPGLLEQPDYTQESASTFNPRQLGGSYPEPQTPAQPSPEIPPPGGMEFASPSIRENMSFESAKRALKSPQHQQLRHFNDRLEEAISHAHGLSQANNSDVIGDWVDGAENSTRTVYGDQPRELRRVALALKGLHGGQKQVASFHYDPEGPHDLYNLTFDTDNVEDVRKALSENGINFRSITPAEKGKRVQAHIIDTDKSTREGIENLLQSGKIYEGETRNGHAEFLGDPQGASRYDAAREFRRILQESGAQVHQGEGGPGVQSAPWWTPFHQEAEANFQRLAEQREFQRQAEAEDMRLAALDRADIPADIKAHRLENQQRAIEALSRAPQTQDRSIYDYKLGHKKFPSETMTKRDIGEFFDAIHSTLDYNKGAHREIAADALTHDILHSLAGTLTGKPSEAYGWYDNTVRKTINKTAEILPKIKTDPLHELAFKIGLAATSQGQDVFPNAESAYHVYKYWEKHGEFPTERKFFGGGTKAEQMEENFAKINKLWDTHGPEKLREILETPISVKALKAKYGLDVGGEEVGHTVRGAMGMGPKIGSFLSNLLGHFDSTTMDLWFSRNLNMIGGNMFGFSEKPMKVGTTDYRAQLEDLKDLISSGDMKAATPEQQTTILKEIGKLEAAKEGRLTRPRALKLAPELHNWAQRATKIYQKSYGQGKETPPELRRSWHPDFDTPENGLAKRMHENVNELSDAPRNASERKNWRKIMARVNEKLADHGIHLDNADKQALGWFDIKDLFKLAGSNSKRNADYLDAAFQLVRRHKNGELPDLTNQEP